MGSRESSSKKKEDDGAARGASKRKEKKTSADTSSLLLNGHIIQTTMARMVEVEPAPTAAWKWQMQKCV